MAILCSNVDTGGTTKNLVINFINLAWVTAVSFAFSFILLVRTVVIVCSGKEKNLYNYLDPIVKVFEENSKIIFLWR